MQILHVHRAIVTRKCFETRWISHPITFKYFDLRQIFNLNCPFFQSNSQYSTYIKFEIVFSYFCLSILHSALSSYSSVFFYPTVSDETNLVEEKVVFHINLVYIWMVSVCQFFAYFYTSYFTNMEVVNRLMESTVRFFYLIQLVRNTKTYLLI